MPCNQEVYDVWKIARYQVDFNGILNIPALKAILDIYEVEEKQRAFELVNKVFWHLKEIKTEE